MKRIKEQIDYGDSPERMDPRLVNKLGSPDSLYGKNPAMKKGVSDVERLISQRFQKVANKLRDVTGIADLSSQQVQGMVYREMMAKVPNVIRIESRHKEELEQLAKEVCLEESEIPEDWYQIEAKLNREPINVNNFRMAAEEKDDEEKDDEEKPEKPKYSSFEVEDLTDEEEFELEVHKRNIINAIIQGAAKRGHYVFQKPEVKARLDAIDPSLYRDYLGIMAINDFLYFTMEQMIEMMSQTGQGVAGKVELQDADSDEEDEEGEDGGEYSPDTKIVAEGLIFPILCHEIIKGLEEAKGMHGLPKNSELSQKVQGQTDVLSNEPMQLRIGPEIVEKIRFSLPDEIFDPSNKGLINWFYIVLYQIPAKEFLEIIGNAISENTSKLKKATSKFEEIMKEAQTLKEEFENYKEENDIESSDDDFGNNDDDDEDLDDFFSSLGITRPK